MQIRAEKGRPGSSSLRQMGTCSTIPTSSRASSQGQVRVRVSAAGLACKMQVRVVGPWARIYMSLTEAQTHGEMKEANTP